MAGFCSAPAGAQSPLVGDGADNYQAVVRYDLEARLVPEDKLVRGRGRIRWQNRTDTPATDLWWHLYLNAFRSDASTFMKESGGNLRGDAFDRGAWGWVEVTKLSLVGTSTADLLPAREFVHPDDDNADDRTVMRTPLPVPIAPQGTVEIEIEFISKLPKAFARSGYANDFFMVAQWYPKLGVFEVPRSPREKFEARDAGRSAAWNCHQYHAKSEFYADYGEFRVALTVPEGYEVGATGARVETKTNADGTLTHVYAQDRVHDFAWTADPRFLRFDRKFLPDQEVKPEETAEAAALLGLAPSALAQSEIEVVLLLQPEHLAAKERYFRAVFDAIKWFGLWYGAYPYDVLTVVDPPRVASGAGGMEYPTLITGGARWGVPDSIAIPESVTIHEFGHQYWYGLVGSNEFEESWLDEGFNSYSTGKVIDRTIGRLAFAPSVLGWPAWPWFPSRFEEARAQRARFLAAPDLDAVVRDAWRYRGSLSYSINSYPRPALVLRQLERDLGPATFARAMRAYHLKWRYRHPRSADFIAELEEASGRSLGATFERMIYSEAALDYELAELDSQPVSSPAGVIDVRVEPDGTWSEETRTDEDAEKLDEANDDEVFRTTIVVARRGDAVRPVTIEVELEDGKPHRFDWDGAYRWKRFELFGAKAVRARVYAEGSDLLDVNHINDSKTIEPNHLPGFAWGATILHLVQVLGQLLGGLL